MQPGIARREASASSGVSEPPMIDAVAERRDDITRICRHYRVRTLELFGSAVCDRFEPGSSDLDFLVTFEELELGQYADCYFGILEELTQLFRRPVDLVMQDAIENPYFLRDISLSRTLLYAA